MVMDVAAVDVATLARAVETVALGQEVLERPGAGVRGLSHRPVTTRELRLGRAPVGADAPVEDLAVHDAAGHPRVEVGQAEGGAGETYGYGVARVQAEEPDARFALRRDVGRSEEHTSELQSRQYLVCRLLLEKK